MSVKTQKKENDDIFPTVLTVPINKPWILTKEAGEEISKKFRATPLTSEERAEIKEKARKLRQKPEKANNG